MSSEGLVAMSIDDKINDAFTPIADAVVNTVFFSLSPLEGLDVKLILVWLVLAALFFTVYLGFVNFRYFKHAIDLLRGAADKGGTQEGELSRFQALMTSLSGTVGLGNIAGVAVAISVGGPGAMVWMILMGLFSMSTKFAEVMLAVKYRQNSDADHFQNISGGPMYYIKVAFDQKKLPSVGMFFAGLFAVLCIGGALGGGNMFQANQAYQQALFVTEGSAPGVYEFLQSNAWVFGLFLAFLVGLVIIGGLHSIAAVTSRLVPAMGVLYVVTGLVVIGVHAANIPDAFAVIFKSAFSSEAGIGGVLGGILLGVQRAAFSNEAGLGSAAIVHSTAKSNEPVSQGFVGMLGPFIDTIVICTVTALVIVVSGVYVDGGGVEGVELTARAFASGAPWFTYVLAFVVFLFAYSTLITWSYYSLKAVTYLFGENKIVDLAYKIMFCGFVVVGCTMNLGSLVDFSDAMLLSMGIPNIIALYLLAPEMRKDVKAYGQALRGTKSSETMSPEGASSAE